MTPVWEAMWGLFQLRAKTASQLKPLRDSEISKHPRDDLDFPDPLVVRCSARQTYRAQICAWQILEVRISVVRTSVDRILPAQICIK